MEIEKVGEMGPDSGGGASLGLLALFLVLVLLVGLAFVHGFT